MWWIAFGTFFLGYFICAIFTANKMASLEEILRRKDAEVERLKRNNRGTWVINPDGYYPYCNQCGYEPPYFMGKDNRTPYCANCGANMRKEVEDE